MLDAQSLSCTQGAPNAPALAVSVASMLTTESATASPASVDGCPAHAVTAADAASNTVANRLRIPLIAGPPCEPPTRVAAEEIMERLRYHEVWMRGAHTITEATA